MIYFVQAEDLQTVGLDKEYIIKYYLVMKKVPLKALKEDLSKWADEAHNGTFIEVTRYNEPYVLLSPLSSHPALKTGPYFGTDLMPAKFKTKLIEASLKSLLLDRNEK
jgi:antitoxin (DNA-binding transcriptional repressor) of toxin-antitoxin stability system